MTANSTSPVVDHNAIKFTQVSIVLFVITAWVLNLAWLIPLLAVALLIGTVTPTGAPLRAVYRYAALPLGIVRPNPVRDEPAPHRFAQGVGTVFLLAASAALYGGLIALGWILAAVVGVLAAVNVLWDFCAGCFVYHQLRRAGLLRGQPEARRA